MLVGPPRAQSMMWWAWQSQGPAVQPGKLQPLSRAMPDIYRQLRVERVAPFFQAFQAELSALSRRDDSPVCVLTPGPMNETYFEHAYLARYLGFLLVEGEDLTVRDDGVFIRTVSGLKRAEVLLRRLDSDFADPLELNARSRLGVSGLVQAVRNGNVVIANSLGAGLVEARALLAFLPALAPAVLGTELKIPNIATWWLSQSASRCRRKVTRALSQAPRSRTSKTSERGLLVAISRAMGPADGNPLLSVHAPESVIDSAPSAAMRPTAIFGSRVNIHRMRPRLGPVQ